MVFVGVTVLVGVLLGVGGIVGHDNLIVKTPPVVSVLAVTTIVSGLFNVLLNELELVVFTIPVLITVVEFQDTINVVSTLQE